MILKYSGFSRSGIWIISSLEKPDCIVTYMIISLNSWRTVLSIEGKYKKYHDALGKEGFEALCWREDYIRQAIEPTPFDKLPKDQIAVKLIDALKTDKTYTKSEVKDLLQGIYKS